MVSAADAVGLAVLVLVNTAVAAVLTRFFRVRMRTRWGSAAYVATVVPFVLVVLTLVFGGVFQVGPDLGSPAAVVFLVILVPLSIGVAFDYLWMPHPDEIDLPTERDDRQPR